MTRRLFLGPVALIIGSLLNASVCAAQDIKTIYEDLDIMAYYNLGAEAEVDESMLKIAESECATDEIKSSMYYSIGVNNWKRAYDLSIRYASRNINIQARAPFHYRSITNPADKRKFDDCLTKGFEYIDKALAVNPEYAEAMFYKALFCREKQKTSADAVERKRWADEAIALADKATKIQNEQRKEANK